MGGYFPGGDVEKKEEGKLSKASKDRSEPWLLNMLTFQSSSRNFVCA